MTEVSFGRYENGRPGAFKYCAQDPQRGGARGQFIIAIIVIFIKSSIASFFFLIQIEFAYYSKGIIQFFFSPFTEWI